MNAPPTTSTRSRHARSSLPDGAVFELVPLERLRPHEEIVPSVLDEVLSDLKREGGLREPILVAREGYVVLNGHHRLAALSRMGARRIPAWVIDYLSDAVDLERWPDSPYPGKVTKEEVLAHARASKLLPPKTTRHTLRLALPAKMTPIGDLL